MQKQKTPDECPNVEKISNTDNQKQGQSNRDLVESINLQLNGGKFIDDVDLPNEVEFLNDDF